MPRLEGKVVFVSGATSGIGKVTAEECARAGARVVLAGRRGAEGEAAAEGIRRTGGEAIFVRTYGALHVLFNNAGGSSNADGKVTEGSLEEFWRVIKLDLYGTFLCCRFGIPAIVRAG